MIPVRLQLQNFLSYGNDVQTVDFSHYKLMCLSGKNGHGKSALLDAITWAIWGQARKIGGTQKADQGLLRVGQTHMKVIFDFVFNKQTYRIRREFAFQYNKPWTQLEFGILQPETNILKPLTDKTIKATQEKIIETLKLDYNGFISSAFLRQGNANEFSKRSAKERKEILGTILGLQYYEEIKKRALEKLKLVQQQYTSTHSLHEHITKDLAQFDHMQERVNHIDKERRDHEATLNKLHHESTTLEAQLTALEKQHQAATTCAIELKHAQQREAELISSTKALIQEWRSVNKQKDTTQYKKTILQKKDVLHAQISQHNQQFERSLQLTACVMKLEKEIHTKQQTLEVRYRQEQEAITQELQQKEILAAQLTQEYTIREKQHIELLEEKKTFEAHGLPLDKIELAIKNKQIKFEKRKIFYHEYVSRGNYLTQIKKDLVQKISFSQDIHNPSCPTCEQNISAARKRFLQDQFNRQLQHTQHQLNRIQTIIPKLKQLLVEQHAEIEQLQQQQANAQKITQLMGTIKIVSTQQEATQAQLQVVLKEKEQVLSRLDNHKKEMLTLNKTDKELSDLHTQYETHLAEKNALEYNPDQHKKDQATYDELQKELSQIESYAYEITKQHERRQHISSQLPAITQQRQHILKLANTYKQYAGIQEKKDQLHKQKDALQAQIREHTHQHTVIIQTYTQHNTELNRLKNQQKEALAINEQLNALRATIDDYQLICQATGKDGIQAVMIDHILPEIEAETNQLLAKLTDNQTHIIIDSLRDLKNGNTKETLDIKVSDPAGIRPYELFSGGEAFRIDFALRIAISKLLARRAGTSLQTLIIDEGFGSQDEEGLNNIMDAIHKIQHDFAKIIIVSHLHHMKDQFPVHFVVQKRSTGSYINVIEY